MFGSRVFATNLALLLAFVAVAGPSTAGDCPILVGSPSEIRERIPLASFDHAKLDRLLAKYVDCRGFVSYRAWKDDGDDVHALLEYLHSLGRVDLDDPNGSSSARMACYINAYNALVLWGILLEYPTASIQLHNRKGASYRIFDDLKLRLNDRYMSLNEIENDGLRSLGDPRIHYALVCAATSCPRLRNEAYRAEILDIQLGENAVEFFASKHRFQICRLTRTVYVSPILKWFRDDFGRTDSEILATIAPYLSDRDREWVCRHSAAKICYLGYNWALNDACPTVGVRLGGIPFGLYAAIGPKLSPTLTFVTKSRKPGDPEPSGAREVEPAELPPAEPPTVAKPEEEPPPPKAVKPKGQ